MSHSQLDQLTLDRHEGVGFNVVGGRVRDQVPTPKEQPPWNLSGSRTASVKSSLESGCLASHRRGETGQYRFLISQVRDREGTLGNIVLLTIEECPPCLLV